jgi:hypothetical protein
MTPLEKLAGSGLLACLGSGAWTWFLPSQTQSLTKQLPSDYPVRILTMPPAGTKISLPLLGFFHGRIQPHNQQMLVAMPSCQSCAMHRINWKDLLTMSGEPIVLIFDDKPDGKIPFYKSERFRVLVVSLPV